MALGASYVSLAEMKTYLKITGETQFDAPLQDAIDSASREIDDYCHRQFNDAGTVSERVYPATSGELVIVDDFNTAVGLIVESEGVVLDSGAYQLEPLNGVLQGVSGWPYWMIRATTANAFTVSAAANIAVTARWGWTAVPSPVKQAAKILTAMSFKLSDAPLGVAGMGEFGVVRVRDSRLAVAKLTRYVREGVLVA